MQRVVMAGVYVNDVEAGLERAARGAFVHFAEFAEKGAGFVGVVISQTFFVYYFFPREPKRSRKN